MPLHEAKATQVKVSRVHARYSRAQGTSPFANRKWNARQQNGRANRWDVWFVPGHCSLTFQLGTLVAEILSNLKSKKLLGVVSVHNCSLRQLIISEACLAYAPTPSLDFSRA